MAMIARAAGPAMLACIWILFLVRGIFYISFVPLWEGFDEWAHYATLQNIATTGRALIRPIDPVSHEVQMSLELAPVPWLVTGLKQDDYWRLPEAERKDRERKLQTIPAQWTREPAAGGEHAYEAQQAPLYYWLLSPAYRLSAGLTLPARVWLLRFLSLLVASLLIPTSFLTARQVFGEDRHAAGVTVIIATMPELMMTVSHIGNDSLAIGLGGLFLFILFAWLGQPRSTARAAALGTVLGLALLTKAYFLALMPPLLVSAAVKAKRERVYGQLLAIFGGAILIAAWWYARNWGLTHSLSGEQFESGAQGSGLLASIVSVNWLRAADFTFLTHIWLGNWSFLVVRSWMYRFFAAMAGLAVVGLVGTLVRKPGRDDIWLLAGIYVTFLLALAYHAARAFQKTGFPGALGYYLFAIVTAEVILAVAGLEAIAPAALLRVIVPAGTVSFAALEIFGMSFYSIPYYTGLIAHLPNGNLPAMRIGQLQWGGWHIVFARLAVNKPAFLTAPVIGALWIFFVAATVALIGIGVRCARKNV